MGGVSETIMKEVNELSLVDCILLFYILNQLKKLFAFHIEGDLKNKFAKYKHIF